MQNTTEYLDITGKIGPLYPEREGAEWPMYSFAGPSHTLWNAIANRLHEMGWTEARIREWLQSKETRRALDGELGEALEGLGRSYADRVHPRR